MKRDDEAGKSEVGASSRPEWKRSRPRHATTKSVPRYGPAGTWDNESPVR